MPEIIQAFEPYEVYRDFGGILRSLDCLWMNSLDAQRTAGFKPLQLCVSSELGFAIPKTLLTNEPTAVLDFFELCHGRIIGKTLHGNFFAGGGDTSYIIHTSRATHLQDGESGSATLKRFFQESEHIRLQPANVTMEPIMIPREVWDREWSVQGKVIAVLRSY